MWVNQERTRIGDQLRRSDADNRAIGGTLNLNALWSKLGTFSVSYNDDRRYNSHYYTADYYQTVYSGAFGSLGLRAGIQRYNNGDSSANTGKYIALDLSLPLGNWFSAGMTHQNGYTMANLSARKQFDEGTIRTIGANLSRAISGDTGDDKTLSGGAYAQFDARYASGTLNVNSAADGYVNTTHRQRQRRLAGQKTSPPADEPTGNAGGGSSTPGWRTMVRSAPGLTGGSSRSAASVTTCRSLPMVAMRWSCRTAKTRSTATTSSAGARVI